MIKWKPDFTYDTVKKGTNRLVCYDRSGQPGQQPFSLECTSLANLDRVAQNMKFEAWATRGQALFEAAEKDGTRVKPEFGSVSTTWAARSGRRPTAHHRRCPVRHRAVPGTARQQQAGRRVDHECGHVDRAPHDPGFSLNPRGFAPGLPHTLFASALRRRSAERTASMKHAVLFLPFCRARRGSEAADVYRDDLGQHVRQGRPFEDADADPTTPSARTPASNRMAPTTSCSTARPPTR